MAKYLAKANFYDGTPISEEDPKHREFKAGEEYTGANASMLLQKGLIESEENVLARRQKADAVAKAKAEVEALAKEEVKIYAENEVVPQEDDLDSALEDDGSEEESDEEPAPSKKTVKTKKRK